MADQFLSSLSQGKKDLKPVGLAFYAMQGGFPWDTLPTVSLDEGQRGGVDYLTPAQAIQKFKDFVPTNYSKNIGSWIQTAYPGIQTGENVYDWMQRTKDQGQMKEQINLLKNPDAKSQDFFKLNDVLVDKNTASNIMGMTPEQLQKSVMQDIALSSKMQAEQATEKKRQADIKTFTDQGKTAPKELLAPGQGEGNGSAGFQTGNVIQKTQGLDPSQGGLNTSHVGESTKIITQPDGKFSVVGADTGKTYANGLKTTATALAVQNQITGGSTPALTGFSEIYAQPPTSAEISAGIQPIMGSKGKIVIPYAVVNPELALKVEQTSDKLKANKEFVNAVVEAYTGKPATSEQLKELVGKKVEEVKNLIKQVSPINQIIKEQVESIYGDVSKLTVKDIPDIAASPEAIEKLKVWNTEKLPEAQKIIPPFADNAGKIQEEIKKMQGEVKEKSSEATTPKEKPPSILSPEGEESADAIADALKDDPVTLQKLLSGIPLTSEDIEKALVEKRKLAKSETDPYYNQLIERAQQDFTLSLQYESEQRKLQEQQQAMKSQLEQEQLTGSLAEKGLATSGIREKLDARLAQQQEGVIRSQRLQFARQNEILGRQAEEYLGSANVTGLKLPEISGQFKPSGKVKGAVEREQTTNIETRARDLLRRQNLLDIAAIPGAPSGLISNLV